MFRRRVVPLRDVVLSILRREVEWIEPEAIIWFQDVLDHLLRVIDQIDTQRELMGNVVDASLALGANRMNEVMKKMTSWGAILIVATLVAGIYGMNFKNMPELSWHYGYFFALGTMLVTDRRAVPLLQAEGLAVGAGAAAPAAPAPCAPGSAERRSRSRTTTSSTTSSELRTRIGIVAHRAPSVWAWIEARTNVVSAVTARVRPPTSRSPAAVAMAAKGRNHSTYWGERIGANTSMATTTATGA